MILAIVQNLANFLLAIVGILAIIAFVIAGLMYILSFGNEEMAGRAKRTFIAAIIGITIAYGGKIIIEAIKNWLSGRSNF